MKDAPESGEQSEYVNTKIITESLLFIVLINLTGIPTKSL